MKKLINEFHGITGFIIFIFIGIIGAFAFIGEFISDDGSGAYFILFPVYLFILYKKIKESRK